MNFDPNFRIGDRDFHKRWGPPRPDTALVSLKEQWANIAADRLKVIEQLSAKLTETRARLYRLTDALRELIDDD